MKLVFANDFIIDVASVNEELIFVDGAVNRRSVVAEIVGAADMLDNIGIALNAEATSLVLLQSGDGRTLREYKNVLIENVSQFMNNFNLTTNLTFSLDFVPENWTK